MRPLSALYYVKENKGKALVVIFLLLFTPLLALAGNYINSIYYYWDRASDYFDRLAVVSGVSADEDGKDYEELRKRLMADEDLIVLDRSGYGYPGLPWICTMGFEMGSSSVVFNSPEDMKTAFAELGIEGDLSDIKDGSVCVSSALARQYGLKKGDIVDASVYKNISGTWQLDAILEDDSYILFYVDHTDVTYRMNIISRTHSGDELRSYIEGIRGELKGHVDTNLRTEIKKQFAPFELIFGVGIVLLSSILAVIINSVITGQYIARNYEFGVYRAIGLTKKEVFGKCASEILLMDLLAIAAGAVLILLFIFLGNELYYRPAGKYLPYISKIGIYGFLASNLLVILPTILLKGRSMCRADVTEF